MSVIMDNPLKLEELSRQVESLWHETSDMLRFDGRTELLEQLNELWGRMAQPRHITILGSSGVGKTTLISAILQHTISISTTDSTGEVRTHTWEDKILIDTPGLADRYEKVIQEALDDSDLLLYVMPLSHQSAADLYWFQRLAFEQNMKHKMMLVFSKQSQATSDYANVLKRLEHHLNQRDLHRFRPVSVDAIDCMDRHAWPDLAAASGFDTFLFELKSFVRDRGQVGRVDRMMRLLRRFAERILAEPRPLDRSQKLVVILDSLDRMTQQYREQANEAIRLVAGRLEDRISELSSNQSSLLIRTLCDQIGVHLTQKLSRLSSEFQEDLGTIQSTVASTMRRPEDSISALLEPLFICAGDVSPLQRAAPTLGTELDQLHLRLNNPHDEDLTTARRAQGMLIRSAVSTAFDMFVESYFGEITRCVAELRHTADARRSRVAPFLSVIDSLRTTLNQQLVALAHEYDYRPVRIMDADRQVAVTLMAPAFHEVSEQLQLRSWAMPDQVRYVYRPGDGLTPLSDGSDESNSAIVVLLESPHSLEYTTANVDPLWPGVGPTGLNLERVLAGLVSADKRYPVIICNPLPFPTDLVAAPQRDQVFEQCLHASWVKDRFIERLNKYNPQVIINACTHPLAPFQEWYDSVKSDNPTRALRSLVKAFLHARPKARHGKSTQQVVYVEMPHPSAWGRAKPEDITVVSADAMK